MIQELFDNMKLYGWYLKTNNLNGLEYFYKIKSYMSNPANKNEIKLLNDKILGNKWEIELLINSNKISNIEEIYNYFHNTLKIYGEDGDEESKNLSHSDWLKYHHLLQLIRIPKNKELDLISLLQIAYNIGQLSIEMKDPNNKNIFTDEIVEFYNKNNLENLSTYIKIKPDSEKILNPEEQENLNDFAKNFNNFLIYLMNHSQAGQKEITPFYSDDIATLTKNNKDYRKVIFTGKNQQFVLMSIEPGDNIKMELHQEHDQFTRVEEGTGEAIIDGQTYILKDDSAVIIPAGSRHEIKNTGSIPLKLYNIYSPPEHPEGLRQFLNPDKTQITNKEQKGGAILSDKNKYLEYKNRYKTLKKFINKYYPNL